MVIFARVLDLSPNPPTRTFMFMFASPGTAGLSTPWGGMGILDCKVLFSA